MSIYRHMPHVSKNNLSKKNYLKIHKALTRVVLKANNEEKSASLIDELLTETEKIMIAKRLVVILMKKKGYTSYQIGKALKVSHSTVLKFSYNSKKYKYLGSLLKSSQDNPLNSLLKNIEKIIELGIFKRYGRDRFTIHKALEI